MRTPHKHAEVIHAWAEGAKIETKEGDRWISVGKYPAFAENQIYRIKPVPDSINWFHVHPDFKWMARDSNGTVYLFKKQPTRAYTFNNWTGDGFVKATGVFTSLTVGGVDWKESLVQRPESE